MLSRLRGCLVVLLQVSHCTIASGTFVTVYYDLGLEDGPYLSLEIWHLLKGMLEIVDVVLAPQSDAHA